MALTSLIILLAGVWLVWAGVAHWLLANPRGDVPSGLTYRFIQVYARWMHRLRVINPHNIPRGRSVGPMIVVCNHTAGIDPMLVQAACPFYVRWMMAQDMKLGGLNDVWSYFDLIFVDRTKPDAKALRQAVRAIKAGEVIGVFPEGRIERPHGALLPFQQGVGMMAAMSGAPVLPILIRGTPEAESAWGSIWRRSHSELVVGALMHFPVGAKATQLTQEIETWFLASMRDSGTAAQRKTRNG
jgi:1-acyl-sn-glycerol-3-phosphate acyltransferase